MRCAVGAFKRLAVPREQEWLTEDTMARRKPSARGCT
jgi:hypothetical protein